MKNEQKRFFLIRRKLFIVMAKKNSFNDFIDLSHNCTNRKSLYYVLEMKRVIEMQNSLSMVSHFKESKSFSV